MGRHKATDPPPYIVIAKAGKNEDGTDLFVKYHVRNLLTFTKNVLDAKFPDWKYMNVFSKETGDKLDQYTKNNRPTTAKVPKR